MAKKAEKATLLWIDLEMTGLSPEDDRILEVAAIATDWDMNEIDTFTAVVKVDEKLIRERMVGEFWEKNKESYDAEWPKLNAKLHYRQLDVSSWKIYFENALHRKFMKPENHRALDDIRGSIEELKWYLKMVS